MEKEALEKLREIIVKKAKNFPQNYRCYEGARRFAVKLKSLGMDVVVKDGGVIYDTAYLAKDCEDFSSSILADLSDDLSEEERKGIAEELKGEEIKSKIKILNSWCEINENSGNTVVIDWHASFKLSPDCGMVKHLIIDNKNNLPHTYIPMGIAFRKWVIFRTFPPRAIKLRM